MGKKLLLNLFLIALLFLSLGMQTGQEVRQVGPLSPTPSLENGEMTDETPSLWFVELLGLPLADGGSMAALNREKVDFRLKAKGAGLKYQERFAFDNLWNGLSIRLEPGELAKLKRIPGVKALYPVMTIFVPKEQPVENYVDLITALSMTGADIAQSELGFTGQGIHVGIIDTGIDYDHPALGGDGVQRSNSAAFPTARVVAGYDFVGDAFNADSTSPSYNPVPVPDGFPDDCAGHGSHVSGIVGANGAIKGVAPDVMFGAYRVFGCAGSTFADVMIAAMERALYDQMDIINMSIGSAFQWPQYPTAQAGDRLVNKGVVVVASIGNNGPNGTFAAGAPGVGKKVIGVASFDNTANNLSAFTVSPDNASIGYLTAVGCPPAPLSGTFPMARTGTSTIPNYACSPLPAGSLAGKIALIQRGGGCTFYVKAYNAQQAGAIGVVLYNNTTGIVSPTVAGSPPITIPVVSISQVDGELINSRLAAGPVNLTWTSQSISTPIPTGNLISSFSSYGLAPDLSLKPDLGAPGGSIRSTYPIELGSFANLSGTSMASPHVAGAVALLLQAKPHTSSQAVRSILQNSSIPHVWWGNPGLGYLDNVHRQGAGMLRIDDAILATTKIEPGKLAAGEGQAGPSTHTLTLENNGMVTTTYDLSYINALSTNRAIASSSTSPAPITFWTSDAYVTFSSPSVIVPAGGTASVDVTIYPALGPTEGQYGGYIVFTPQEGGQVYRVPFAGFVGDYQSVVALSPTPYGFPWLAKVIGSSYVKQPLGATYTLAAGDVPYILLHLDHQVRRLRLEVFSTAGKAWHRAFDDEYLGRNTYAISFFAIPWDGKTLSGNKIWTVPNGTYVIKLSVLKALGDDNNPAHWEIWTSPVITISRP